MSPDDILFIRRTFGLSQRDLAKSLSVAPFTVARWEKSDGGNEPTGLQAEILRALYSTAFDLAGDSHAAEMAGGQIALGIGALIYHLLKRDREIRLTKERVEGLQEAVRTVRKAVGPVLLRGKRRRLG